MIFGNRDGAVLESRKGALAVKPRWSNEAVERSANHAFEQDAALENARTGLLARVALTPEDMPVADALEAVRIALGEGVAILNFSFHSPSLAPGHTPYVRDAADLAAFFGWWDKVLGLLAERGARAITFDAVVMAADAALASKETPA